MGIKLELVMKNRVKVFAIKVHALGKPAISKNKLHDSIIIYIRRPIRHNKRVCEVE